ncbi:MAG: alpha/beta hydrolase [Verrucomicrobiales bacterium]
MNPRTPVSLFAAAALSLAALASPHAACAGDPAATYKLWPSGNPGGWAVEGDEVAKVDGDITRVSNVNEPTIAYYPPPADKATDKAIIIAPGGGYRILAITHEGGDIAEFLAARGIHAFVLKYRLPKDGDDPRTQAPLEDAQRAIRLARSKANELGYDKKKVGLMGFSAGGNLTAITSNAPRGMYDNVDDADQLEARPDFAALIYPAYLVDKKGDLLKLLDDVQVSRDTPPTFLFQTTDDGLPVEGCIAYYLGLKKSGVAAELHIAAKGGHGYGLLPRGPGGTVVGDWGNRLADWLLALP